MDLYSAESRGISTVLNKPGLHPPKWFLHTPWSKYIRIPILMIFSYQKSRKFRRFSDMNSKKLLAYFWATLYAVSDKTRWRLRCVWLVLVTIKRLVRRRVPKCSTVIYRHPKFRDATVHRGFSWQYLLANIIFSEIARSHGVVFEMINVLHTLILHSRV